MRARSIVHPEGSEFNLNALKEKGHIAMQETFTNDTGALDALLACLSEHDLAALQVMQETFTNSTDTLEALLACLSEHDLAAAQAIYASRLTKAMQEMDQSHPAGEYHKLVQDWNEICQALVIAQARRRIYAGSYEW